ncbi:MAG TPA: glycosyltransferase [Firmicutes bacterium]|nr:glycosyltransferase [Bacillota bacterium]
MESPTCDGYYGLIRPEILERVPHWAKTILDVGCGTGALGAALKSQRPDRWIAGVEIVPEVARRAARQIDHVTVGDISQVSIKVPRDGYDVIICADVLEHLPDPWRVLQRLASYLSRRGLMILSLPNFRNILELALISDGSWDYGSAGIFDRTHLRYFTPPRARQLVEAAGLRVYELYLKPDPRIRIAPNESRLPETLRVGPVELHGISLMDRAELTAYQIILTAGPEEWLAEPGDPEVSIIVVNWNQRELLARCLGAIRQNSGSAHTYEIIVVDNGSDDGSLEYLEVQRDVKVIRNDQNVGFTVANNQGAEAARGRFLVFLNNDTEVQPGWLDAMIRAAGSPDVGAVGAKLVYPNGRLQDAGAIVFSDGSGWNYGRGGDPNALEFNRPRDVDYCSGAALLVKSQAFWAAGAFDPRYAPAYYEDTDLCFSLRARGWRVLYEPKAVVVHIEGATAGQELASGIKLYQTTNKEKFVAKWSSILPLQYPPALDRLEAAAERVRPLRVLVMDDVPPVYDRASRGQRLFQIIQLLVEEGHQVSFFCRVTLGLEHYLDILRRMGVAAAGGAVRPDDEAAIVDRLAVLLSCVEPDVIWIEGYPLVLAYLDLIRRVAPKARVIADSVDLHFLRDKRLAGTSGPAHCPASWQRTREIELAAYRKSDVVVTVTDLEKELLKNVISAVPIITVPNIHEVRKLGPGFTERKGLLFVGNFLHQPNLDGILWFLQEVWPAIVAEEPDISCTIVGYAAPPALYARAAEASRLGGKVTVTGYVPDLTPYLASARVSIAPLRAGAGMKGKIAEAMACGLPVVTTSIGAEGMELTDGVNALIRDDAAPFAAGILEVYRDRELWNQIAANGMRHVREHYSANKVRLDVRDVLREAVRNITEPRRTFGRDHVRQATRDDEREPLTSIVIPCWNQVEVTRQCVESIFRNTSEPFELILVDNGSTDGTSNYLASLAADRPNVRVIRNTLNTGFAHACNQGIAAAKGKQILIMNNDVIVPPGWLTPMLRALRAPNVGLVGPRTNRISGEQQADVPYGDDLRHMEGYAKERAREEAHMGRFANRIVGFCMLAKREVIERIGGFDVTFGIGNFEDDDFCIRTRLAGFKIWIADDAFVHHLGSRTFIGQKLDFARIMRSNFDVFRAKWSLPSRRLEDGIPVGQILGRRFDERFHRCPLTSQEVAEQRVSPPALAQSRGFHFLMVPDWRDPRDRWLEALSAFVTAFSPTDDVGLIIRVDPLTEPDVENRVQTIVREATQAGIDLDQGHMVLILNDVIPPMERAGVYRTAQAIIDTSPPGTYRYVLEEAQACGLKVCQPSVPDLTGTYEMSRVKVD